MRLENNAIPPISRSAGSRRAKRDDRDAKDAGGNATGTALVPVSPPQQKAPKPTGPETSARTLVNTQLLAQKLPHPAESRLARMFPERALDAYRDSTRRNAAIGRQGLQHSA